MRHSKTKSVPFESLFGYAPPDVRRLRPFGYRVLYRPTVNKMPPFGERLHEGLLLCHNGGGIYHVLAEGRGTCTKHMHILAEEFPVLHPHVPEEPPQH